MQNNTDLIPFPSVDITTVTQTQLDALLLENEQLKQGTNVFIEDVKVIKNAIVQLSDKVGFSIDSNDGESELDYGKLMSFFSKLALMNGKKRAKEFEFVANLYPRLLKYKDL